MVERTCSAAMRPVAVAGSIFGGDGGWRLIGCEDGGDLPRDIVAPLANFISTRMTR